MSQMSQVTSRMSLLSSDEDLDLEDPFVRQDHVRQFRYLRAQFEDETLEPGEIPDLVAEAECRYDNKGLVEFLWSSEYEVLILWTLVQTDLRPYIAFGPCLNPGHVTKLTKGSLYCDNKCSTLVKIF